MTESAFIVYLITENIELETQVQKFFAHHHDVQLKKIPSLDEFANLCRGQRVDGLLIDIKSSMKGAQVSKILLANLEQALPVARIRLDSNNEILSLMQKSNIVAGNFWEQFFAEVKKIQIGRFVRKEDRYTKYLSIETTSNPTGLDLNRFITKDVSINGLFILSTQSPEIGSKFKIKILEVDPDQYVEVEVRWTSPWEQKVSSVPGFGVQFKNASQDFTNKLSKLLGP